MDFHSFSFFFCYSPVFSKILNAGSELFCALCIMLGFLFGSIPGPRAHRDTGLKLLHVQHAEGEHRLVLMSRELVTAAPPPSLRISCNGK